MVLVDVNLGILVLLRPVKSQDRGLRGTELIAIDYAIAVELC